jgi:transposase
MELAARFPGLGRETAMALTDGQWAVLEPLIGAARPRGKVRPRDLRRTIEAVVGRHRNGATWRSLPAEYGPSGAARRLPPCGTDDRRCRSWWRAAQLAIRWSQLGAWERLLGLAQARGVDLGMVFLDGTSIRAHPKAAGAPKKGAAQNDAIGARRSAARVAASAPRHAR